MTAPNSDATVTSSAMPGPGTPSSAPAVCDGAVSTGPTCSMGAQTDPAVARVAPSPVPASPSPVPIGLNSPLPNVPVTPLCSPGSSVVGHSLAPATQSEIDAIGGCERIEGSLDLRLLPRGVTLDALASLKEVSGTLLASGSSFVGTILPALEGVGSVHLEGVYAPDLTFLPRPQRVGLGTGANDGLVHIEGSTLASLAGLESWGPVRRLEIISVDGGWQLSDLGAAQIASLQLQNVAVPSLTGLSNVRGLRELEVIYPDLDNTEPLVSLEGLSDGSTLEVLALGGFPSLTSLAGLPALPNLRSLTLGPLPALTSFDGLPSLPNLRSLNLGGLALTSLDGFPPLPNLRSLSLDQLASLTSLDGLQLPSALDLLELGDLGAPGTSIDLSALAVISQVGRVVLNGSLPLSALALHEISALFLPNYGFPDLHGLEGVSGLESLSVTPSGAFRLDGLTDTASLRELHVTNVTTLAPAVLPARMRVLDIGPGIADLRGYEGLQEVDYLWLSNSSLVDLSGLSRLEKARDIGLFQNANLVDASALAGITSVGDLDLSGNDALLQLPDFSRLTELDSFSLSNNAQLVRGPGFPQLHSATTIRITGNPILQSLGGFAALDSLDTLDVESNPVLEHLGFSSSFSAHDSVYVLDNPALDAAEFSALQSLPAAHLKVLRQVSPQRPCPWSNDGVCDEPELCEVGSDADCRLLVGDPLPGSIPRALLGVATVPRTGVPAGGQLLSASSFAQLCRRSAQWETPGDPSACAPLAEVLAQPSCIFITQGCGLTRVESESDSPLGPVIRWYANGSDLPVGMSDPQLGLPAATQPIDCDAIDTSCDTCGVAEPFCTNLSFPAAAHPTFAAVAVDPTTASAACSCEPQPDGTSRVSSDCFCALYGCPDLDALQEECDPQAAGPVFAEEINCNQLAIQIGQGTGRRYAFDAQTGALVGAEAFAPNAGVLPCDGTRLTMGDPLLDAGSLASYARGVSQLPAELSAGCDTPRFCSCGFDPNTECLSSGAP